MLPPKDQMQEQLSNRFKSVSDVESDTPRMQPGNFGPPQFGEEDSHFYNDAEIDAAYEAMEEDVDYDNVEYEPHLEQPYDEELTEGTNFTPPPPWQGTGEYPTPPSLRQPQAEFTRDEPMFPGGPSKSEVNAWKKKFESEGHSVYLSEVSEDLVFIWRTLSRTEYREIMALPNTDPLQREEIICEVCVLYPYNYNFSTMASQRAGIPAIIAEQIMHQSGFQKPTPPVRL